MSSVFSDIKDAFRKNDNQIIQMIMIFGFVFLIHWFLQFSFGFTANKVQYQEFLNRNYHLGTNFWSWVKQPWTLLIYPFSSRSFLDVIFNSLALYWFGNLLADFIGAKKVLSIFVFGALFAALVFVGFSTVYNLYKPFPVAHFIFGSSAGIYAVLFAALALLPDYELMFFRIFIKLRYIAVGLLIFSLVMSLQSGIMHLSAAIYGYIYIKFEQNGISLTKPFAIMWDKLTGKKKKKGKSLVFKSFSKSSVGGEYRQASYFESNSYPDQEEIDHLLDKINKAGSYDALTKEEKMRLHKASQKSD